ncbi:MAG: motility associated factor glycosyltransferase family protein [Anaerolineales bacterium]|nr:motility associated factor glycosyltransferase family protein [Anaerolineales bacterium]
MNNQERGSLGQRIAERMSGITLLKITELGFANAQTNSAQIATGKSIASLQETSMLAGDDALVIAAGPSLHRNDTATLIKQSGFKGVIVATESSMSWCLRHDIIPHLIVTLDPHPHRIVRWFGDPELTEEKLTQDDYYTRQDMDPKFHQDQLRFNQELLNLINAHGPQMHIAIASSASQAVVQRAIEAGMDIYWWNPMYDDYEVEDSLTRKIYALNGLPCVNAGGNVGSACWVFAHAVLSKTRVGLVGMDFGYYADTPYNQTQYYKEIVSLVGLERLDEVFVHIVNPHLGQEFYTDPAYLWYRNSFLEMAQEADCKTYNCTGGGILFGPGIHWMILAEFLQNSKG